MPAIGWPPDRAPANIFQSIGFTLAARTAIRICPGPACGSGASAHSRTSGPPYAVNCNARIRQSLRLGRLSHRSPNHPDRGAQAVRRLPARTTIPARSESYPRFGHAERDRRGSANSGDHERAGGVAGVIRRAEAMLVAPASRAGCTRLPVGGVPGPSDAGLDQQPAHRRVESHRPALAEPVAQGLGLGVGQRAVQAQQSQPAQPGVVRRIGDLCPGRGAPRCAERASGSSDRNRRGTAGGVTPRAVRAAAGGAPRAGSGACGGADVRVDDAGAGMAGPHPARSPVGRPSPGSGAAVRGPHAVAPWTPKVAGFVPPRLPAIASGSQQSSADHRVGAAPWRPTVTNVNSDVAFGVRHRMGVASPRIGRRGSQGSERTLPQTPGVSDRDQPDQDRQPPPRRQA